ncbi:MAG: hypothetical protein ACRC9M_10420, partial [Aeromonas sp.]
MATQKLTSEQWLEVRRIWQADSRDGYTWLVRELDLGISAPAVRKTALKQGWQKRGNGETQKPAEKPKSPSEKPKSSRQKPKPARETKTEKPETKNGPRETITETKTGSEKPKRRNQKPAEKPSGEVEDVEMPLDCEQVDANDDGASFGYPTDARTCTRESRDPGIHDFEYAGGLVELLGRGKSGLYRSEYALVGYRMALLGATVSQIADAIGVNACTIHDWKARHTDFCMALRSGRQMANANVAARLYQRATGYSYESEEIKVVEGEIVRVPVV